MVAAPLDAVLQCGGPTVRDGCLALLETATAGWLQTLPVIPQHGDLFIDNVLRYREEYHIVDWDSFGEIDLPFHDLITLLLSFLQASSSCTGALESGSQKANSVLSGAIRSRDAVAAVDGLRAASAHAGQSALSPLRNRGTSNSEHARAQSSFG